MENLLIKEIINMCIENEGIIIKRTIRNINIIIIKKGIETNIENKERIIKQMLELKERKRVNIKIIERKGIGVETILKKIEEIIENEKKAGIMIKRYIKKLKKNRMIKGIEVTMKGRMNTGRGITRSTKEKIRIGKIKKSTYEYKKEKGKRTKITKVGKYTIRVIITHRRRKKV